MVEFGTAQRLVRENKLAKNAARRYRTLPGGAFVKEEPD
jgi:hypothetical protein